MELNTKVVIEVKYSEKEDKKGANINFNVDLSLNELLTSVELGKKYCLIY